MYDPSDRSLVWGVYLSFETDDDATFETRTPSMPIGGEDCEYIWRVQILRSGFAVANAELRVGMWLEPRVLVPRAKGMLERGAILYFDGRVDTGCLEYGRSLDSKYEPPHIARRYTLVNITDKYPLLSARVDQSLLQVPFVGGRICMRYDACKYFGGEGAIVGQLIVTAAWLELDDPGIFKRAIEQESNRVVCVVQALLRPDESSRTAATKSYLSRPQKIETFWAGKTRTFYWKQNVDTFEDRRGGFGLPVRSVADHDERQYINLVEGEEGGSKVGALISARFLEGRAYMPDNDLICNLRTVLPLIMQEHSTVIFKFYNLRHERGHHHRSVEIAIRWAEFMKHRATNVPSAPIPIPAATMQDSRRRRRRGRRKRTSNRGSSRSENNIETVGSETVPLKLSKRIGKQLQVLVGFWFPTSAPPSMIITSVSLVTKDYASWMNGPTSPQTM